MPAFRSSGNRPNTQWSGARTTVTIFPDAEEKVLRALDPWIQKVGKEAWNEARRLVPVDTGHLQSTISWDVTERGITIAARAKYAAFVEYGTRYMSAQPYLRPGLMHAVSRAVRR